MRKRQEMWEERGTKTCNEGRNETGEVGIFSAFLKKLGHAVFTTVFKCKTQV